MEEEEERVLKSCRSDGEKKCAEGGQARWALMDVDLRVVAVKLTNRFRGVCARERESTSALLKYI